MKTKTPKLPLRAFTTWDEDTVSTELGLNQVSRSAALDEWLSSQYSGSEVERTQIEVLRQFLAENVILWNEDELKFKFLGPLMQIINFDERRFRAFTQRKIEAVIGKDQPIRIGGIVDFMVAMGRVNPRHPFFFLHEYKKERGSANDPLAQVLVEMLAAQTLNGNDATTTMHGCYIVGRNWFFLVLEGNEYAVSDAFVATQDDIFQIVAILKSMKQKVQKAVSLL